MEVFVSYAELKSTAENAVVAIGSFDGMHRGHQVLFERVRTLASEKNASMGLITFHPHPVKILAPELAPPTLMAQKDKIQRVEKMGFDFLLMQEFTPVFADMSPKAFVEDVLVKSLNVSSVVVGYDFSFGKKAAGKALDLQKLLSAHNVQVEVITPQRLDGLVISSTKIRQFILDGKMRAAHTLLGRPFHLSGLVVKGDQRGRQIGTPTANIEKEQEITPARGVYAVWAHFQGEKHRAVVNVGLRPTFEGDGITVEAHLLDFKKDIYGQRLRIDFVRKIRPERKFASKDELIAQIQKDIEETKKILSK